MVTGNCRVTKSDKDRQKKWNHYSHLGDTKRIGVALQRIVQSPTATDESKSYAYHMLEYYDLLYKSLKFSILDEGRNDNK